jgi:hypothetical protein
VPPQHKGTRSAPPLQARRHTSAHFSSRIIPSQGDMLQLKEEATLSAMCSPVAGSSSCDLEPGSQNVSLATRNTPSQRLIIGEYSRRCCGRREGLATHARHAESCSHDTDAIRSSLEPAADEPNAATSSCQHGVPTFSIVGRCQRRGASIRFRVLEQYLEYSLMNSLLEGPVVCWEWTKKRSVSRASSVDKLGLGLGRLTHSTGV